MHVHDDIIVLRQFENSIDANIAKTKLDAYDVPCFLTEENMANLYPGQNQISFHIRLHVFKKDIDEALNVLADTKLHIETSEANCPKCHSRNIQREFPKEFSNKPFTAIGILLFGVFFPHKKINHCLDCDNEF